MSWCRVQSTQYILIIKWCTWRQLYSCTAGVHSFIRPFLYRPFKSSTTQRRSRLQHGYCIGVSRRSPQATIGKRLAQGPYMAARTGVEPTTLRLKAIDSSKAPPCPMLLNIFLMHSFKLLFSVSLLVVPLEPVLSLYMLHTFSIRPFSR